MTDLARMEDAARDIARGAGDILLKGFRSASTVVSYKSRTNLVTDADRASEDFIYRELSDAFPDHSIVAEEGSGKDAGDGFVWYVDPLDGTNNYAHGIDQFCVSLGVTRGHAGPVVMGVIFDPCRGEMFTATEGGGAFLNGNAVAVSETGELGYSILATGFPYDKDVNEDNNLREFGRIMPRVQGIRRMGSAALDMASVACGRFEGYWERGIKSWDIAAGVLLVREAGGAVTGYRGEEPDLNGGRIAATNGRVHSELLKLLASD